MALITLDQAKLQLRITPDQTEYDADLELKIEHASAIVLDYLEDTDQGSPEWTDESDPISDRPFALVQAAVLEVLTNLWRHRGDESADGPLTSRVVNMLRGLKVPSLS